ncbi:hypothetical protein [Streptomyces omiyaensis]|uniref:Uncharacterized protein n=1 Tax=Streptomyces omiyaensis TaxID=68247 RepID=A0ABW7BYS8_9ACTN
MGDSAGTGEAGTDRHGGASADVSGNGSESGSGSRSGSRSGSDGGIDIGVGWSSVSGSGDGLVALLRTRATAREPDERITVTAAVCASCGWDCFEVVADECFCEGCCLPLGVRDGGVHPDGFPWRLTPALPWPSTPPGSAPPVLRCPGGHDLFEAAVAHATGPAGEVRRVWLALRCTEDGTGTVHVDGATVTPAPCSCHPAP